MTKTAAIMTFVLGVFLQSGRASAQAADEVAKLKREIELLKKENDLLTRENSLLKKENQQLKPGGASTAVMSVADGFEVGTKLVGTVQRSWMAGGRPMVLGDDVEFEVTKRSGAEFSAEYWAGNRKFGTEVEGTIDANGIVRFKSTRTLTETNVNLVGVHTFTGRFDKGTLTGRTTKKGDPSYRGDWKLKTKKD